LILDSDCDAYTSAVEDISSQSDNDSEGEDSSAPVIHRFAGDLSGLRQNVSSISKNVTPLNVLMLFFF
jgi:hypothetical protein